MLNAVCPECGDTTTNGCACTPPPAPRVTLPQLPRLMSLGSQTVREIADSLMPELGIEVYDTALPHLWTAAIHERTGTWPQDLGVVWAYRGRDPFGTPLALTQEADKLLADIGEAHLP